MNRNDTRKSIENFQNIFIHFIEMYEIIENQ